MLYSIKVAVAANPPTTVATKATSSAPNTRLGDFCALIELISKDVSKDSISLGESWDEIVTLHRGISLICASNKSSFEQYL
jgi:hypothetical protein